MARTMWIVRGFVAAVCLTPHAFADDIKIGDSITAGIETAPEHDGRPFGYRVTWINWDSGFRNSGLQLGDKILGVNGERYTPAGYRRHNHIGDYLESGYWQDKGAKDKTPATLIVWRNYEEITVTGTLRANRFYYNDAGKQVMGPGGPERRSYEIGPDGKRIFDRTWSRWYEEQTNGKSGSFPYILDGGWERTSFNNQKELAEHMADKPRIDLLNEKYPGEFTQTLTADFERVRDYLDGDAVTLPDDALDYRTRQEEIRKEIKNLSTAAITSFETELGDTLEKSPSITRGDIKGQIEAYNGKIVYFDGILQRNIVNDLETSILVAGNERQGYYFLTTTNRMRRSFDALYRYRTLVNPKLAERYSVYIEVTDKPQIITFRGDPVIGLMGKLVAIAGGRQDVFVDARPDDGPLSFAGEVETKVERICSIEPGGAPQETITCMIDTIKYGDEDTWRSLFADWSFEKDWREDMPILWDPNFHQSPTDLESAWRFSRKIILDQVFDARIKKTYRPEVLYEPGENDSVPKIEGVRVIVEHIGRVNGAYRTFTDLHVRRVWDLERINGGVWKICRVQHL